jgi:hypothetical protein
MRPERGGDPPVVVLDDRYRLVDGLEELGEPSLLGCRRLEVSGPVRLSPEVIVKGDVVFENPGAEPWVVPAGVYQDQRVSP